MKKIVWKFGLISGSILAVMTAVMIPLCMKGVIDFDWSEIIGYSTMVLAFILVFFGIRTYRDNVGGGTISFGRAFKVGILITLVACAMYVISWEIVYFNFIPDFADKYTEYLLEKMRESGASAEAIAAEQRKMSEFKKMYANPFVNVAITFMEVFPLGLIVTLVSAAILRRKPEEGASEQEAIA